MSTIHRNCEGVARRDFIKLGIGAFAGLGFTNILRQRAAAATIARALGKPTPSDVRCILIWLDGGPSHYESFDPKPDAPREIRGEFKPIPTKIAGAQFSEVFPKLADVADKLAVLRSVCHRDPNHGGGNHYMMTGAPTPVPVGCGAFVTFHPSYGSVVSFKRGIKDGLPAYMSLPTMSRSGGPNFLGAQHAPFVIGGDPNRAEFKVRDVVLPAGVSEERAESRRTLRESLDRLKRFSDTAADDPAMGFDSFYRQGVDLVTSPRAQAAFDLSKEPAETRDLYGRTDFGQRLLLCRRLVEVGVSFVTCYYGGWDHHTKIFTTIKDTSGPKLDRGIAGLITDLSQRGLLDSTLVICMGEFGRTPKINKDAGRDHWPHAMSILAAGAGMPGGQIIGATDAKGYYASDNVHSPEDLAASLYTKMGIDPTQMLQNSAGRPVQLVNGGHPIKELFA
ncbi:MAG TPA: DUF1501 domain-containing protein [Humisphaera sp.]|jgi:hypothetical protein|nr:DUF1501 domain-containing protein [Humisphaera sp.]